jgi:hypothetical protein
MERTYPALVGEDGLLDGADELVDGRRRHAHALGAVLHPPRVLLRPEQRVPGAARPPVRLHPLEQALGVVEDAGGRTELDVAVAA